MTAGTRTFSRELHVGRVGAIGGDGSPFEEEFD